MRRPVFSIVAVALAIAVAAPATAQTHARPPLAASAVDEIPNMTQEQMLAAIRAAEDTQTRQLTDLSNQLADAARAVLAQGTALSAQLAAHDDKRSAFYAFWTNPTTLATLAGIAGTIIAYRTAPPDKPKVP